MIRAIDRFKRGFVIILDDDNRENEGDLVIHASNVTEDTITFMKNNTSGIICISIDQTRANELNLKSMVQYNEDKHNTAFTVTCDDMRCTTGISSYDRCLTIKTILNGSADQLNRPGHVFPLVSRNGGIMERRGHTEASIEMCKITKMKNCAVICELMNADGTTMDKNDIMTFASLHSIPVITIDDIHMFIQRANCEV